MVVKVPICRAVLLPGRLSAPSSPFPSKVYCSLHTTSAPVRVQGALVLLQWQQQSYKAPHSDMLTAAAQASEYGLGVFHAPA